MDVPSIDTDIDIENVGTNTELKSFEDDLGFETKFADRKVDSFEDETNDIETHFNDNDFNIDTDHELDFKDMDQKDLEFEDEDFDYDSGLEIDVDGRHSGGAAKGFEFLSSGKTGTDVATGAGDSDYDDTVNHFFDGYGIIDLFTTQDTYYANDHYTTGGLGNQHGSQDPYSHYHP